MTAHLQSREQILAHIRAATDAVAQSPAQLPDTYASLSRGYVRRGSLDAEACLSLMVERLRDYDAEIVECTAENLPAAIASQLKASGKQTFVAPPGLPASWFAPGFDWKIDRGLSTAEIEKAQGVVTASTCGIADSGTIVLHHGPAEGRRVLTLLPDWHLCVLQAGHVVETLPEYFERIEQPPALATYISGPSATADIEMTRIKGVHGPRFLHVILVRDEITRQPAPAQGNPT